MLTSHNVNQARRDSKDSLLNRITLKIQYRLADHIFVHTEKMKTELLADFGVGERSVTVIPFGINNSLPETDLTPAQARQRLGIAEGEKAILFLGRMRPYKGLEYLLTAFKELASSDSSYRLIVASEPKKGSEEYLEMIRGMMDREFTPGQIIVKICFIPDAEMEMYLKAADVLVLPYKEIFQSGVLFLAYSFGLPVVATEWGLSGRRFSRAGPVSYVSRPTRPTWPGLLRLIFTAIVQSVAAAPRGDTGLRLRFPFLGSGRGVDSECVRTIISEIDHLGDQ